MALSARTHRENWSARCRLRTAVPPSGLPPVLKTLAADAAASLKRHAAPSSARAPPTTLPLLFLPKDAAPPEVVEAAALQHHQEEARLSIAIATTEAPLLPRIPRHESSGHSHHHHHHHRSLAAASSSGVYPTSPAFRSKSTRSLNPHEYNMRSVRFAPAPYTLPSAATSDPAASVRHDIDTPGTPGRDLLSSAAAAEEEAMATRKRRRQARLRQVAAMQAAAPYCLSIVARELTEAADARGEFTVDSLATVLSTAFDVPRGLGSKTHATIWELEGVVSVASLLETLDGFVLGDDAEPVLRSAFELLADPATRRLKIEKSRLDELRRARTVPRGATPRMVTALDRCVLTRPRAPGDARLFLSFEDFADILTHGGPDHPQGILSAELAAAFMPQFLAQLTSKYAPTGG